MTTEKIKAQDFSSQDIEARVEWINNPSINSTMFFDLPATVEDTTKWYKRIITNENRADFSFFLDKENTLIGMGGLTGIDSKSKNAEFYVMINPDYHSRGYGKRISQWLFNYAFLKFDLHKLYLHTNNDNVYAYKIYEDSGFVLEGILRQHKIKNGFYLDRRFYGLLQKEWEDMPWKENQIQTVF
ncbi:GNAT family N-acetyltransferase [Carboxylicivirga sp. RSCT41]|uniref:GNAT family N-acetyltransferase n=1 Tax=Carboxylicivirga agarovorans TaxID=3417570 RepID=UPI003D339425